MIGSMIIVFGSLNMDLVLTVPSIPRPGETVLCEQYISKPGGKGCNQAVAAARAGAPVRMIGQVGGDTFGDGLLSTLDSEGIDAGGVRRSDRPTGVAFICVDPEAENAIAVASGANLDADVTQLDDATVDSDSVLVLQMEVPAEQNWQAIQRVRAAGGRSILNLAPAAAVPLEVLKALDLLIVNEIEAQMIASELGLPSDGAEGAARAVADLAGLNCVVTLGSRGALGIEGGRVWQVDSMAIDPVDTTGAGDAFTGVLAAAMESGCTLPEAMHRANIGAALACMALGAQESLPTGEAITRNLDRVPPPRSDA